MPNIPFPDVPPYSGVPALVRSGAIPPEIQISLGLVQSLLTNALQSAPKWGIFDSNGNQLGLATQGNSLLQTIIQAIAAGPILSNVSTEFVKETRISDFPVEMGSFASYNKVEVPANPIVTLALSGSATDRTTFLNQIDTACKSTNLYSIVTPEVTYANYSIERYSYQRKQSQGATLLMVEISLKEIRQVSAAYSTIQTPINQPQNPAATPQTNSGLVQPQPPGPSTLRSIANAFPSLGNN